MYAVFSPKKKHSNAASLKQQQLVQPQTPETERTSTPHDKYNAHSKTDIETNTHT